MPVLRLRKLKVREVSLVDKGAGKGVRVLLFKRRSDDGKSTLEAHQDISLRVPFAKVDAEKRQVFGWAYVSDVGDGTIVDYDKQMIEPTDLEEAAYDFNLESRKGGEMHERAKADDPRTTVQKSRCIESLVTTIEKQRALFNSPELREPVVPVGWWIGFQVDDDETWEKVKSGELAEFSIAGSAQAEEVEAKKERKMPQPSSLMLKVKNFLGLPVKKDYGSASPPRTVGEIIDGQKMRSEMWKLSDALMESVNEITYSSSVDYKKRVELLKRSVEQFGERVEKCMDNMSDVEKSLARDALNIAEETIVKLEANEQSGEGDARAFVEKAKKVFDVDVEKAKTKPAQQPPETKDMPANTKNLADILKALPESERAVVAAALKDPTVVTTPPAEPLADFWKSAPAELRDLFKSLKDENAALKTKVDAATVEIEKAKDDKILAECLEVAKGYKPIGVDVDTLALTLKGLGKGTPGYDALIKQMDVVLAKSLQADKILTTEIGRDGKGNGPPETGADAKLTEIAKSLQAEAEKVGKPITFSKARTMAMEQNPKLYKALTRQVQKRARAAGEMLDDMPE